MLNRKSIMSDTYFHLFPDVFVLQDGGERVRQVKNITFQVTEDCSLRCSYCYQINKQKNYMTKDVAKEYIDYLFEHRKDEDFFCNDTITKGLIIEFIGGEPLLNIDLMDYICDYFEKKCIDNPDCPWGLYHYYSISTNGVAYFEPKVQKFLSKYGRICSLGITIDGCKELHDKCRLFPSGAPSYDIAIKAALDWKNRRGSSTKITLCPENVDYIYKGITNMLELGFYQIHINPAFEEGWNINHAKIVLSELIRVADYIAEHEIYNDCYIAMLSPDTYLERNDSNDEQKEWCGASSSMMALDYKGDIYPCLRFMESSLGGDQPAFKIGSIKDGIAQQDQDKKNFNSLQQLCHTIEAPDECKHCLIGKGCSWCLGYNYQKLGTINKRVSYICDVYKASAIASKYLTRIVGDWSQYDNIKLNYELVKNIISEDRYKELIERR